MSTSSKINKNLLIDLYSSMLRIRMIEETVIKIYGHCIQCPVHLYHGQEAIAIGISKNLQKRDLVFSNHRCHGHYLAKGGNLNKMFAELMGKSTGCSKGKGGSMHLIDTSCGFMGSSSIVAGNIPIACGAALGLKRKNSKNIAVVFFGDGATNEGVFYETINFAALWQLPVLFICENNFYATNSHITSRQKGTIIANRTSAFKVPSKTIEGNDVLKVYQQSKTIIGKMRKDSKPFFLECLTYRHKTHMGIGQDQRPEKEINSWMKKCPIKLFKNKLLKTKILDHDKIVRIENKIQQEINSGLNFANKSPFPRKEELFTNV